MNKGLLLLSLALLVLTQTGCSSDLGTTQVLGAVNFARLRCLARDADGVLLLD